MDQEAATTPKGTGKLKKIAFVLGGTLVVGGVIALGVWTTTCPCDGTPGFVLLGEKHDQPVGDWSFANDVDLCQVQMSFMMRPHSINLNCMATPDGELYLSCSVGERKWWCPRVKEDHPGKMRLDGVVYPVVINRVMDEATLDEVWVARVAKLQDPDVLAMNPPGVAVEVGTPRPGHWWTFHVRSAGD